MQTPQPRDRTEITRVRLFLCVIVLILGAGFWRFLSFVPQFQYFRFIHRSPAYYGEFAHACDNVLREHPVHSNDVVTLLRHYRIPFRRQIPGNDKSLPGIIRRLRPEWVMVGSNFLSVSIPPDRMGGFGIIWHPSFIQPNQWDLEIGGEGPSTKVYYEYRP
jgi:hypothetical protein